MHCRKSLLFDKETAWTKKNHSDMFDVTMGSFDGAEVCELIGLFLLNNLSEKYGKNNVGLYRDDGLVLLRNANGPQSERTRKDITREFKKQGLNISINTNLKICNFLDVTLNLSDGTYYPYRKPNNETLYIDSNSNHPPTIIKHLPAAIGRRISDISSSKELFNRYPVISPPGNLATNQLAAKEPPRHQPTRHQPTRHQGTTSPPTTRVK